MLLSWAEAAAALATAVSTLPFGLGPVDVKPQTNTTSPDLRILDDALQALQVLQDVYFEPWVGTWPTSIDWTAAVMGSHVAGALETLSQGLEFIHLDVEEDYRTKENLITLYFSQLVSFHFGQDAFAIRGEAFDDMLWVVLNWLDAIQFVELHDKLYYSTGSQALDDPAEKIAFVLRNQSWHGNIWVPTFAHRARVFWELADAGWNTTLCGGGMIWNPNLLPYKNAITNELFIAGSINMYLYFPGDVNTSPYDHPAPAASGQGLARDPKYLAAAVAGYKWLTSSNMTDSQGLYTDGFHISGYGTAGNNNTSCDQRNDMVYTYNQGVLLTGQRGLFQVTGMPSFLEDGHALIRSVINATGWDLATQQPVDNLTALPPGALPPWRGIGRAGVLEDACDVSGDCSQDSQTFKGIFMHHMSAFCAPLAILPDAPLSSVHFAPLRTTHAAACAAYLPWLSHNAAAALGTRDAEGRFGMWWTVGLINITTTDVLRVGPEALPPRNDNAVDYRTYSVLRGGATAAAAAADRLPSHRRPASPKSGSFDRMDDDFSPDQAVLGGGGGGSARHHSYLDDTPLSSATTTNGTDPNDRGRGRTVETQGGGLAVLLAQWEVAKQQV